MFVLINLKVNFEYTRSERSASTSVYFPSSAGARSPSVRREKKMTWMPLCLENSCNASLSGWPAIFSRYLCGSPADGSLLSAALPSAQVHARTIAKTQSRPLPLTRDFIGRKAHSRRLSRYDRRRRHPEFARPEYWRET